VQHTVRKLRRIRREHGFTSSVPLAKALGLSHMCIHYWEAGKGTPRPYNADRLVAMLQTPIETLMEPENELEASTEALTPKIERQTQTKRAQERRVTYV